MCTLDRRPRLVAESAAVTAARAVLRRRRPRAVIGFGGFASGPGGLAAWMSGLPLGLGVFWYLFRELGPNASLEPAQQRTRGWVGLVFNFLVTSVAQSVVALTT